MSEHPVLDAIEAERERLRKKVAGLDELEAHARQALALDASPTPPAEPKPKPKRSEEPRARKQNVEAAVLRALSKEPCTSRELQEKTGASQVTVDKALRKLFPKGKVHHDDKTPRTWSLVPSPSNGNGHRNGGTPPREEWPHTEKVAPAQLVPPEGDERPGVVKRRHEGFPSRTTTLPPEPSDEELEPDPEEEADASARYIELRVATVLRSEPRTAAALAEAIDADRDDVDAALAALLATGEVSQLDDGQWCA